MMTVAIMGTSAAGWVAVGESRLGEWVGVGRGVMGV